MKESQKEFIIQLLGDGLFQSGYSSLSVCLFCIEAKKVSTKEASRVAQLLIKKAAVV